MSQELFYFDPLSLVFLPSAAVMVAAMAAPIAWLRRSFWVRRGNRRNAGGDCGRCGASFGSEGEMFVYSGVFVCEGCAERMRWALSIALPAFCAVVLIGAVVAATGFALGGPWAGGPSLKWWFGSTRWIAVLLPGVGLGAAGWMVARHVKRENLLAQQQAMSEMLGEEEAERLLAAGDK